MKSISVFLAAILAALAVPEPAAAQIPTITSITSMASTTTPVAPGMPVLVRGSNLALSLQECAAQTVPLICNGVSATVNGRQAPVRTAHPTQVIIYIPVELAPGPASVVIQTPRGATLPFPVILDQYAPGIHMLGDPVGSTGFFSDQAQKSVSRMNPAVPGQPLTVYAVGLGPTSPPIPTGQMGTASSMTRPALYIAGRPIPVLSSALGCGLICEPGVFLVQFVLPPDIPRGEQPAYIEIAGRRSNTVILPISGQPASAGPAVSYLQSYFDVKGRAMSPGMPAYLIGSGFSPDAGPALCTMQSGPWPGTCQGLTVYVNGQVAALQSISATSVALQIPVQLSPGPATLLVERNTGGQILRSAPFPFTLDAYSPSLMVNPTLPGYVSAIIVNSIPPASPENPATWGDTLYLSAIGLGPTIPPSINGFGLGQYVATAATPVVTVGGRACKLVSSGIGATSVGIHQVVVELPQGLPSGNLPIVLEIGGKRSQDGLLLTVANLPIIAAVTNAASSAPIMVSGSIITIYGRNLAKTKRLWTEDDIIYDWLPTSLDGVEVTVNNKSAVVSYVSPTQLNVIAPDDLAPGPAEVTIQNSFGWQRALSVVRPYSPGLFMLEVPGQYLVALHSDWTYAARPGLLGSAVPTSPAKPGEVLIFYGTGFGPTNPPIYGRQRFSGAVPLADPSLLRVQIGPRAAPVLYAGLIANGLYQINVIVPDIPDGDHEVIAAMGTEISARGRLLTVKR